MSATANDGECSPSIATREHCHSIDAERCDVCGYVLARARLVCDGPADDFDRAPVPAVVEVGG